MEIEYDNDKAIKNIQKHGIAFAEAKQLWSGLSVEVSASSENEPRWLQIGKIRGKFYTCVFTRRRHAVRLISLRRSRKKEEDIYHEKASKEKDDYSQRI